MPSDPSIRAFENVFDVMRYPAGESHVSLTMDAAHLRCIIAGNVRNFEDLCHLMVADDIFNRVGRNDIHWFVPYFPFGRHDRRRDAKDGFELGLAVQWAKTMHLGTLDPHSEVLAQLPHIAQSEVVRCFSNHTNIFEGSPTIVIPDAGAGKKAHTWLPWLGLPWVQGHKIRDQQTGRLSGFGLDPSVELHERDVVIVDDICDGGGTFVGLWEQLRLAGVRRTSLLVTHGLFTQGADRLTDHFDRVLCCGPYQQDGVERIPYTNILKECVVT